MYCITMKESEVLPVFRMLHFTALFRVVLRLTEMSVKLIGYCPGRKLLAHFNFVFLYGVELLLRDFFYLIVHFFSDHIKHIPGHPF